MKLDEEEIKALKNLTRIGEIILIGRKELEKVEGMDKETRDLILEAWVQIYFPTG